MDITHYITTANALLDAYPLDSKERLSLYEALDLSIKMHHANSIDEVAYFLRRDGELEQQINQICEALKNRA